MASLENRNGIFRIKFRFDGKQISRSLKTKDERQATLAKGQVERNLELVSLGMLDVPTDCDIFDFFLTGTNKKKVRQRAAVRKRGSIENLSIERLFKLYFDSFLKESVEENTYSMLQTHRNNLLRLIGKRTKASMLGTSDIQSYVDKRSREPGRRGSIKPVTIRKEITTLSSIFRWAVSNGYVDNSLDQKSVRYPKGKERLPFQTWDEIQKKIRCGGLAKDDARELWECLFLDTSEVESLLKHVERTARHSFIHPMFAFAAYTGARRSEIARSELADLDFDSKMITIRELKRVKGMQSTRRVPMSPLLGRVLQKWVGNHPGGQATFCMPKTISRSSKVRVAGTPLTPDEMHDHFCRPIKESKWEVLHGWHVLRHSFCSNCAAAGVEQRVINEWVGHQTEDIVRRYRHLFPSNQQKNIRLVFGPAR